MCKTYPRDLYVPITASKPIIVGSSKFRSKGRFPVLTYFYQEKKVRIVHTVSTNEKGKPVVDMKNIRPLLIIMKIVSVDIVMTISCFCCVR